MCEQRMLFPVLLQSPDEDEETGGHKMGPSEALGGYLRKCAL
jgi:hypothetical protein